MRFSATDPPVMFSKVLGAVKAVCLALEKGQASAVRRRYRIVRGLRVSVEDRRAGRSRA